MLVEVRAINAYSQFNFFPIKLHVSKINLMEFESQGSKSDQNSIFLSSFASISIASISKAQEALV